MQVHLPYLNTVAWWVVPHSVIIALEERSHKVIKHLPGSVTTLTVQGGALLLLIHINNLFI